MRIFFRIILGLLFIPVFLFFLILTSLKFQLLNYGYLSTSFERNRTYENVESFTQSIVLEQEKKGAGEEERESYQDIAEKIKPELLKKFVERNLKQTLDFINGESEEIIVFLPANDLGIDLGRELSEEIPLTTIAPNFPQSHLDNVQLAGKFVLPVWLLSLFLVAAILFAQFKLGWKDKFSEVYFIFIGLVLIILGILLRFFLIQMARDLVKAGNSEPSQVLIGMLASSILPEMVNIWIVLSFLIILLSVGILLFKRLYRNNIS